MLKTKDKTENTQTSTFLTIKQLLKSRDAKSTGPLSKFGDKKVLDTFSLLNKNISDLNKFIKNLGSLNQKKKPEVVKKKNYDALMLKEIKQLSEMEKDNQKSFKKLSESLSFLKIFDIGKWLAVGAGALWMLTTSNKFIAPIREKIFEFTGKIWEWMQPGLITIKDKFTGWIMDDMLPAIGKALVMNMNSAIPKALFKYGNITKAIGGVFQKSFKILANPAGWLLKSFGSIFGKIAGKAGLKAGGKAIGKGVSKTAAKKIPVVGAIIGLVFGIQRFMKGDVIGGLMEVGSGIASIFPGVGTAISIAIDGALIFRDLKGGKALDKKIQDKALSATKWSLDKLKKVPGIGLFVGIWDGIKKVTSGKKMAGLKAIGNALLGAFPGGAAAKILGKTWGFISNFAKDIGEESTSPPVSTSGVDAVTGAASFTSPRITGRESIQEMIKRNEGLRLKAYQDTSKGYSIGYGHFVAGKSLKGKTITEKEADRLFQEDYNKVVGNIRNNFGPNPPRSFQKLDANAKAAVIDLTYNMGPGWFTRGSGKYWGNLVTAITGGDKEGIKEAIGKSLYAKQVGRRASQNIALLTGESVDPSQFKRGMGDIIGDIAGGTVDKTGGLLSGGLDASIRGMVKARKWLIERTPGIDKESRLKNLPQEYLKEPEKKEEKTQEVKIADTSIENLSKAFVAELDRNRRAKEGSPRKPSMGASGSF